VSDPVEIRGRLKSLPKELTEAYEAVFTRMTRGDATFAYRILGWIFHAQRILSMRELQEALVIRIGVLSLDRDLITNSSIIVRLCGGFVNHDKDNDLVTFSHETVREFLEKHKLGMLPSQAEISRKCLTYLQLPQFTNMPSHLEDLASYP